MRPEPTTGGVNVDQYRHIHQSKREYGAGSRHFDYVRLIVACCNFREVIDYGCGKGVLADQINELPGITCAKFDPAVPGFDVLPDRTFDAVINTDVLEHIPSSELDSVLKNFLSLSQSAILIPHLAKAREVLPNGENAHCTIKSPAEWNAIFAQHYRNVVHLSHASPKHALFFCSNEEIDTSCMSLATAHIARGAPSPGEVRVSLSAPMIQRLKSAVKLLVGASGVGLTRKLANSLNRHR